MGTFDQISSPYGVGAAPFRPPVAVQPNDSALAGASRGGLSVNVQPTGPNIGVGAHLTNSLASVVSTGGPNGSSSASALTTGAGNGGLNQAGFSNGADGSCNMGMPSGGPASNPDNGGNPGATPEQTWTFPAAARPGSTHRSTTG